MKRKTPEITDDMQVSCINALATTLSANYGEVPNLDTLAKLLADIVGKPVKDVHFLTPTGGHIPNRKLPNILCASSKCKIRITRENGLSAKLRFPSTVGKLDEVMTNLGKSKTDEEEDFDTFSAALLDTLDAYGHMTWTVGNEDWLACADAAIGRHEGKLYLAHHVVVDCESGGWIDTIEKGIQGITGNPPKGILSQYLDNCMEFYIDDQGSTDPDKGHLQIDVDECLKIIKAFDKHITEIWKGNESDISLDWETPAEPDEAMDPIGNGWLGHDGRP